MTNILAVDDKNDNLITISALLKDLLSGCTVSTALSGAEGIEKARQEGPDVIILDVKMPGMDGFEVCERLKQDEETRHIPIILLTAIKTDVDSRIKGLEIGADAFLTKPIDEAELVAQVNVMLRIKKAEDLLRLEKDHLEVLVGERTEALYKSERKLKKERDFMKTLEDASPAYYLALSPEGTVLTMNRAMLEAMGYELKAVKGKDYIKTFMPEAEHELGYKVFEKLKNESSPFPQENVVLTRQNEELLVEWHIRPFLAEDGSLDFVFFVGVDITQRKNLEKILMTVNEKERHEIGQELHEGLGQHLSGIAFKSEILRLKLKEKTYAEEREITDIVKMVNQAIDQTREIARGLSPVDMSGGGLQTALEDLRLEVEDDTGINCLLQWDNNVVIKEDLEATNLFYIVKEAVKNSVVHGKSKNVIIIFNSVNTVITLKIIDDGSGIPAGTESRGIGLSIMRYRAWLVGATLEIKNNQGGGTIIECNLRDSGPMEGISLEGNGSGTIIENGEGAKASILIVDDSPVVRQGLVQIVSKEEDLHVCGEAQNSDEAIQLIARLEPNLVIIDISLRGAGGVDLVKAMKERYHKLEILVLSDYDETIYAERAIRAGASGYIMKKEALQAVVEAIKTVLNGRQYLSDKIKERFLNKFSMDDAENEVSVTSCLSNREFEIFQLIGHGLSNRHIADRIHISVKTVENFRERIKKKLGIESSSDLIQFAVQWMINHSIKVDK
ncbi:MAG: response regulator [bacterium]|nr:response regulator [bacterium]